MSIELVRNWALFVETTEEVVGGFYNVGSTNSGVCTIGTECIRRIVNRCNKGFLSCIISVNGNSIVAVYL